MKREMPLAQMKHGLLAAMLCILSLFATVALKAAGPTVSNVTAGQRPDTKLVDITYDLAHDADLPSTVTIEATQDGSNWTLITEMTSSSAHGFGVEEGTGKAVVWRAGDEWPAELFPAVKIRVIANDGTGGGVEPAKFSLLPPGKFLMGSPAAEAALNTNAAEETQHLVTLTRAIFVSKTEVTWGEYQSAHAFALANGYSNMGAGAAGGSASEGDDHPVTTVSWWDAILYCNALSEKEDKTPVYYNDASFGSVNVIRTDEGPVFANFDANGYRLLTEAEWEYACRAGTTTAFYTGPITSPNGVDPNLEAAGWYKENGGGNTNAVGMKQANSWGIHDTHGNVWEWCWDGFVADLGGDAATDPSGGSSNERIFRGGGYLDPARNCRSANRNKSDPTLRHPTLGFRVALTATQ